MTIDPGTSAVAFAAGIVSFFAPCVLPVVPGYLAFVTGGSSSSLRRRTLLTLSFVGGFGVMFVLMGALVGAVGGSSTFQGAETWAQRIGGVLIIAFGLTMTGLIRLPLLDRDVRYHGRGPRSGGPVLSAAFLGAAFGVGWSPCVGPVLASILLLAGVEGGAATGAALLSVYALGLAIPFIVLGVTADRGARVLQRYQGVARVTEVVGGVLLIVLGIFVFTGSIARFLSYVV